MRLTSPWCLSLLDDQHSCRGVLGHNQGTNWPGLPDWTFLGPNLQNLDHFNHVWTKKKLFGPLDLWTFRA